MVYGTTIIDKEKFCDTKCTCSKYEATNIVNNTRFRSIEEHDDDVSEVQLAKFRINLNTPIVLGFTIFQTAKLKMLSFYFDFMKYYFHDDSFAYVAMDNDCAYFATNDSLEMCTISTKRLEFYMNYNKWFVPPLFCPKHKSDLVQRNDQNWNMNIKL